MPPLPEAGIAAGPTPAPRSEPWRLLATWDGEPGWNMALDEALLASADPRPALRFYTWKPHALSLGYFQGWREVREQTPDTVLVRRFSGGGAIHHADELTFSIAADQEHSLFRGEVLHSYERVHGLLIAAFQRLGVQSTLRGPAELLSDRTATGMCFHVSTPFDLAWGGRKGVGSAQRRRNGRVLHHGSIKIGTSPLETGVASLRAGVPDLDASALAEAIQAVFVSELGCLFAHEPPRPEELALAAERAGFYRSREFIERR